MTASDVGVGKPSTLDRFLPVWILAAMVVGLVAGRLIPGLGSALGAGAVDGVLRDDELVTGAGGAWGLVELGSAGEASGALLDVDLLAAGRGHGVVLGFGVLVTGGDPRVADPHA